jgi:hypothetical protein
MRNFWAVKRKKMPTRRLKKNLAMMMVTKVSKVLLYHGQWR